MKRFAIIGFLVGGLSACATVTPPTATELSKADYGTPISLAEFNQLAENNIRGLLVDPSSLMFYEMLEDPRKYWAADRSGKIHYGYFGCYAFNSKNRMGGYGGKETHCLFVRDRQIKQMYAVTPVNGDQVNFHPDRNTIR